MTIAMASPQFFLVTPRDIDAARVTACTAAAAMAGRCASIIIPETLGAETVKALQGLGLAVLLTDCEPRSVHYLKADGLHLWRNDKVKESREALKKENLGVFAATSRHHAMEAAELGADYVAFAQNAQQSGEPLIGWWQQMLEIPVVAFDPVTPDGLAQLLPQSPDFIRPSDEMWTDAASATKIVSELAAKL